MVNIKLLASIGAMFVAATLAVSAQQTQIKTTHGSGGLSAASSTTAGVGSDGLPKLPDEKTLLIPSTPGGAKEQGRSVKSVGVWDFAQMILILGLVIAGIYLLFYFLKRAGGQRAPDNHLIDVLSTKVLQQNRSLHLVEIGRQMFVVGSAESGVTLVAEIQDKETIDEIRIKASEGRMLGGGKKTFRDVFGGMFAKGNGFHFSSSIAESMGFMKKQRERLKKM